MENIEGTDGDGELNCGIECEEEEEEEDDE